MTTVVVMTDAVDPLPMVYVKTALLRLVVVAAAAAALEDFHSSVQVSSAEALEDAGVGMTVTVVAFTSALLVGITKLEMISVGLLVVVATGDTALAEELDADELAHALQPPVSLPCWRRPSWLACVRVARAATRASLAYMLTEAVCLARVDLYRRILTAN